MWGLGGGFPKTRGRGMPVVLSVGVQPGSITQAFCYNMAVVRAFEGPLNVPTSGASSILVFGSNFGLTGFSSRIREGRGSGTQDEMIGSTVTGSAIWVSDSLLMCKHSEGAGGGWPLSVG